MSYRYIIVVEGVDYWLNDSDKGLSAEADSLAQAVAAGVAVFRRKSASGLVPYALVRLLCDFRLLTWDEYVASGRKGEIRGMEEWRNPKAPDADEHKQAPEPQPKPGVPGMLRQPRIIPSESAAPEKQKPARAVGAKDAILALLERSPDSSVHDVAARAYGANNAENRKKATNMLAYLRKIGRVTRIGTDKFRLVASR